jgi:NADPH-dependent 2,4-dienoyl-CoA reductase/sulfur reductase-like enzyme/Pyruvate/2-oxoacid:ferredoxin oxidoreductase delta subunit
MRRINEHPVLDPPEARREIAFRFDGAEMIGYEGEMISSALFANGITRFSIHKKGAAPQGIFCANGQCSQCTVILDGYPAKSCVTPLKAGMDLRTLEGLPVLPFSSGAAAAEPLRRIAVDVLVVGGGPSGLGAAKELAALGLSVVIADDKEGLGGKLLLQTHKFFGSERDCYAGTRGFDIARKLEAELRADPRVTILTRSPVVGIFKDGKAGIYENSSSYLIVDFKALVVAAGAREKSIVFPGNDLPGVYGAGAFQTLVNRDRVKAADRVLIVGSGNVGLIGAYHALQAGIEVAGIVEIADRISGYKVHADKIIRMGVPIYLSTTLVSVEGDGRVRRATVAAVDKDWKPLLDTARTYEVDTVLVAAGLSPCDELYRQARSFGILAVKTGDADEIAEASSALFGGRIAAFALARMMDIKVVIDESWIAKREILKSKPGDRIVREPVLPSPLWKPVFFCDEEIPCDPCTTVCPSSSIALRERKGNMLDLPYFRGSDCKGCSACVAACPGLAISLVRSLDGGWCEVAIPFEFEARFEPGERRELLDQEGHSLEEAPLLKKVFNRKYRTWTLHFKVSSANATKAIGLRVQRREATAALPAPLFSYAPDDAIVCRCERVTFGEIVDFIKENEVRDVNQLKSIRAGMGACGSKTCAPLYAAVFRAAGVDPKTVAEGRLRPLVVEMPLGTLAESSAVPAGPSAESAHAKELHA